MVELSILIIFPFLMAFAAASDLITMTISNRISIALVLAFILMALLTNLPVQEIGSHLAVGIFILVITFSLFAAGWIGGGDAKLTAATAVWFGLGSELMEYLLIASALGGALTIVLLLCRRHPLPKYLIGIHWAVRLHDTKTGIPYGIALASSALIIYPESRIWISAVSG